MAQPILTLQELSKYYVNGQNIVAGLNKISLQFERGEFVAITGESGSGKSSLAHILGGILPYEDGELLIDGKPTSHYGSEDWEHYRAESVGFISQHYGILPGATVLENVISALRLTGMEKTRAAQEAQTILEEVELWPMRSRRAAKLSSGQKQRLSIARALAKPCSILIADEPTGNLDPENSDKVIQLLAKAAQDRLVILITHEFSEAEHYVTRHITMQDGRVCADAKLQTHPTPPPVEKRCSAQDLSDYVTRLQLRSRPVWSAIMVLFTLLTAFAVFAFMGSFIVALDDTSTRIYDSDAFLNGDKHRLVVVRNDLAPMTEEDYETILSISRVEKLERFGYIADISYFYQEGEDYKLNYTSHNIGSIRHPSYIELPVPEYLDTTQYMQTVPLFSGKNDFLTAGQLPQQFDQIVAVGDESLIGTTLTVYISHTADWADGAYIQLKLTIVGVTDQGTGLYFHEDLARALTLQYLGSDLTYIPWYEEVPNNCSYINYRNARSKMMYGEFCDPFHAVVKAEPGSGTHAITDDEVYVSVKAYVSVLTQNPTADYQAIYNTDYSTDAGIFHIAGLVSSTYDKVTAVSPARFQQILSDSQIGNGNQVSLTLTDYAYTERVIKALEKADYYALSPYVLGATRVDAALAAQRTQTLLICTGAMLVVLLLQLIVLPSMFNTETESYRTLSDMGLTYRVARRSVFFQVLIFAFAGQLLALLAVSLCSLLGVSQVSDLQKYLYGPWWILLSAIHLAATMFSGWITIKNLRKRVYPRTASFRDLIIDEEETAR